MSVFQLGLVLPALEDPATGEAPRWTEIRAMARDAEVSGFDTIWVPDELLWRVPGWPGPRGWWECVALLGAVAAVTERVRIGSWVLSALNRNPGLTAKVAETVDEISGGRFVLGFGAGHAGKQGEAFGQPADLTVGRYEEALQVLVPALREGSATYEGTFHRAMDLELRPRGPRPGRIPLMLGAHGRRTMRLAVTHADIWSCFAEDSSLPQAFAPYFPLLEEACQRAGRDPAGIGRSVGVIVAPDPDDPDRDRLGRPITGSPAEIAATLRELVRMGFTSVEIALWPNTRASLEAFGPVLPLVRD